MDGNHRGVIRSRDFANQVKDFSGLCFGNITPTDIDGMIEYKNICYVYMESKFDGAELPYGQRLALERQHDDMRKTKPVLTIICTHHSSGDIDYANTIVSEYRFGSGWQHPSKETTTAELITRFLTWVENNRASQS